MSVGFGTPAPAFEGARRLVPAAPSPSPKIDAVVDVFEPLYDPGCTYATFNPALHGVQVMLSYPTTGHPRPAGCCAGNTRDTRPFEPGSSQGLSSHGIAAPGGAQHAGPSPHPRPHPRSASGEEAHQEIKEVLRVGLAGVVEIRLTGEKPRQEIEEV